MAWFSNNVQVLRRWAAQSETPLPEDYLQFASANMTEAMRIKEADPELISVLDGSANAGLKADVLAGAWADKAISPEERAAQEREKMRQELFDSKPFEQGETFNLTRQMMLEAVAPEAAAQARQSAAPDPTGRADLSEAQRRAAEAEEHRVRQESLIKGMAMSKAQYDRIETLRNYRKAMNNIREGN